MNKSTLKRPAIFGLIAVIAFVSLGLPQSYAANTSKVDVIVSFKDKPGAAEESLVRGMGGEVNYNYNLINAMALTIPTSAINGLTNNPNVTAVELDGLVYAMDTELDQTWSVSRINAGPVHTGGNIGTGVKIGIIDSGLNYNHPDLDGVYAGGYDFVQSDNDPMDVYGHGTHVAGSACAEDNGFGVVGVAPGCSLYILRVLNDDGVSSWSRVIAAMDWAVTNNLQVVNLSLGTSRDPGTAVHTAFDNAEAAGLIIAAAAGNSGTKAGKGDNIIYPAKYTSVIAVGATDSNDARAGFSSTGSTLEIMAPGASVLSTWNDDISYLDPQPFCLDGVCYYKYGSGTSMASPHIAGVAALLFAKGVTDTNGNGRVNDEVRQIMNATARDLGAAGKDTQYGNGLVDALAAVSYVQGASVPTTTNSSTVTVSSVTYSASNRSLNTVVSLVDDSLSAVSGTSVSVNLYLNSVLQASGTTTTDTNGNATFSLKNAATGCYTTTVTAVGNVNWDGLTPANEFCK